MARLLLTICLILTSLNAFAADAKVTSTDLPAEAREVLLETQGKEALVTSEATTPVANAVDKTVETPAQASSQGEDKPVLAESEIPLKLDEKKAANEGPGLLSRVMLGLAVLVIMAGGGFLFMRRYGKPGPRQNAPQVKVLTQHWLGPKKSLAIVRVAGESILIGITDHNISMIKSLALLDEEIPVETPNHFEAAMEKAALPRHEIEENGEDFQMTGLNQVRDVVSKKLKNMRSIN